MLQVDGGTTNTGATNAGTGANTDSVPGVDYEKVLDDIGILIP